MIRGVLKKATTPSSNVRKPIVIRRHIRYPQHHRGLAFGAGSDREDHVKVAVLAGSLAAALLAAVVLRIRNRVYRRIRDIESADADRDGIPNVYEADHETER